MAPAGIKTGLACLTITILSPGANPPGDGRRQSPKVPAIAPVDLKVQPAATPST